MAKVSSKIAAIDVGTNSFHMVIASVTSKGQLRIHSRDKEMVRLGLSANDMKYLSEAAIERGVKTLKRFIVAAQKENAIIRPIATSAVREALNKDEFVERVERETGIHIDVVSGSEEGRLVYMGVIHALPIISKRVLLSDIGGGSTETTIGVNGHVEFVHSAKLGTIRLTQRFFSNGNSVTDESIAQCREYILGDWSPTFEEVRTRGYDVFVGTSGTFHTLAEMVLHRRGISVESINGVICSSSEFLSVINEIITAKTPEKISQLVGMDSKRADIILAGSLMVEQLIYGLDVSEIMLSSYALREGIVFDTMQKLDDIREFHHLAHLRYETVQNMCTTYNVHLAHAQHVADLSLQIFDQLKGLHRFTDIERELLEAAAYLHDIGYHISPDQHHKHSYYIIRNSVMPGFTNDEAEIIANIARYHRKSHPKKKHENFATLTNEKQHIIQVLSAILRIAEGLDRRRLQRCNAVSVRIQGSQIDFTISPSPTQVEDTHNGIADVELWGAERRKGLLETVMGMTINFNILS
jgi:exopolyphosphatase / guanosine-5'-triphosphate,3'-diphosphate pyrophosphatase